MQRLNVLWCVLAIIILPSLVQAQSGSRVTGKDPCTTQDKIFVPISQTSSTQLANGMASLRFYVCHILAVQAGSSTQTFSLVSGTGSTCGTSTGAVIGATSAANGMAASFSHGTGGFTVAKSDTDGEHLCLLQSGSDQIAGAISYVLAPN